MAAGLTQAALADAVGCTQATISRWEMGLFGPSEAEIQNLASTLGVTPSYFDHERVPLGGGLPVFYHRSLTTASPTITRRVEAICTIRAMQISVLCKMCTLPQDDYPKFSTEMSGGARGVARAVRATWALRNGPVPNLVDLLESKGAIVIAEDFGCDEVDALCWWRAGLPKLFFVNARKPACRMRFSLAHELGHSIMHTWPTDPEQAEQDADEFAGEFLFPEKEARAYLLPPINVPALLRAKQWWKMSLAAIAVQAKACGSITSAQLTAIMKEIGKRGWRKREPIDLEPEVPTRFAHMLRYPLDHLGFSVEQLATALYTNESQLRKLLGYNLALGIKSTPEASTVPNLRLVGF